MSLWKWKDVELEVDMYDVDFQEKYENAFNQMEITEKELQTTGTLTDFSRNYCNMFFRLFDDIFGIGTSDKLFNGKKNILEIESCYDSFIEFCSAEVNEYIKKSTARAKKYNLKYKK